MDGEVILPHFKVVLLGNTSTGKTSLANRWVNNIPTHDLSPTIGNKTMNKELTVDGKQIVVMLWDTAGQERYKALIPLYTRSSAAVILIAAVDNQSSIDALGDWLQVVKDCCDQGTPVVIGLNKTDLLDHEMDISYMQSIYPEVSAFFLVSAVTNENVDVMFFKAAELASRNAQGDESASTQQIKIEKDKSGCC